MSFAQDLDLIEQSVLGLDPSFRQVNREQLDVCLDRARRAATGADRDAFLLAAMRLLALPRNGHTRLIPNAAIGTLPVRFVARAGGIVATRLPAGSDHLCGARLETVGGTDVGAILQKAEPWLAGTPQRQCVIGALLLAWPAALEMFGSAAALGRVSYGFVTADGKGHLLDLDTTATVNGSTLYPTSEHGRDDPGWICGGYAGTMVYPEGCAIDLPSFFDPSGDRLTAQVAEAAQAVRRGPDTPLLLDLRGNTGGDFLRAMPLVDAISGTRATRRVIALVDRFTFSAAIVFVAILSHRLGPRLRILGEAMGDGLRFWAEGGSIPLRCSGAVVRYSDAFHDWEGGQSDPTTPPEIARLLVPAGELEIEPHVLLAPSTTDTRRACYQPLLAEHG